jgi:hypothetical protein
MIVVLLVVGCGGARAPQAKEPAPPVTEQAPGPAACDASQAAISKDADTRAAPWSIAQHLTKNFPDGKVSWLMKDASYQDYVVKTAAKKWGRCNDTGCYLFAAPAAVIHDAVEKSTSNGKHDPAAIGKALGLPAANFEGTLRMMTLDIGTAGACVRLPVDSDPGVWKCKSAEDTDCFKFGGYTSGGVPEIMVINAPVEQTTIVEVQ